MRKISPMSSVQVVILAGGMGTRLGERAGGRPKPMVLVHGKPVLQYQIELCAKYGFKEIMLLVHHKHEVISDFFGDGACFGVRLHYSVESAPRGTAGALRDALHLLAPRFLVIYGDTFLDVDLRRFWNSHLLSGAAGSLFLHPNDHPHDSDLIRIDSNNEVKGIDCYPHTTGNENRNLVNAALYVLERDELEHVIPSDGRPDIAKHMFPRMLELGLRLFGYVSPEYIKDMGTPDRLDMVERDIVAGLAERLSVRQLRKAVFLDRDGTINADVNHLKSPDEVALLPGSAEAIRRLNRSGTLAVVVTNQPVIARGDIGFEALNRIHARLDSKLGEYGAYLDRIYFCPHHPDKGFHNEVPELKRICHCRKPEVGLIDRGCTELGIGRSGSWMVGDMTSDIEAGRRAGLRTVLVRTGYGGSDAKNVVRPDYTAYDLANAIDWILVGHADMTRRLASLAIEVARGTRVVLIGGLARTGKSYSAQVLKELLHVLGSNAHVISLDGWLKPKTDRAEGFGVLQRYDLAAASATVLTAVLSKSRVLLAEPIYDRLTRNRSRQYMDHSVGPSDILIVEGVPALLMDGMLGLQNVMKVYVDVAHEVREDRLVREYSWRGIPAQELQSTMASRAFDEIPVVVQSRNIADFIING